MAAANILCALIAAGQSKRFHGNKLEAVLDGEMLGTIAAARMREADVGDCIAVTRPHSSAFTTWLTAHGYRLITNQNPDAGLSHSIALAATAAAGCRADALLICLADMPFIPVDHFRALARGFTQRSIVSTNGTARMPPAIFPRSLFAALSTLSGEGGARALLNDAIPLHAASEWLIDIDTRDDLAHHAARRAQK